MTKAVAPFGAWTSPISSSMLTSSGVSLSHCNLDSGSIYWLEGRPLEAGRVVLVRNGQDILPTPFNVRSRVHEYGGGAYTTDNNVVYFVNFVDQRLYRLNPSEEPRPITPESSGPGNFRYADLRVVPGGATLICVRERHESSGEVLNEIVAIPVDGSGEARVIASGHDFFSSPRPSPDGRSLAWLSWDHPNMPWDGTDLWRADFDSAESLSDIRKVAGGVSESVFQPEWSPDGRLHYVSDRTGWWNLYAEGSALCPMEAEFGGPQWVFDSSRYGFLADGRIACIYARNGIDHLALLTPASSDIEMLALPYTEYFDLRTDSASTVVFVAGSPTTARQVVSLRIADRSTEVLKTGMSIEVDSGDLSIPQAIEFPSEGGHLAHALYYAPKNRRFQGPVDERPPLLVMSHGGPTSAASSTMNLSIQYWTTRGFAIADVDYSGSTGYGRAYRERLNGQWGVADVQDCVAVVRFLAARGDIDEKRAAIRGGSAGGYTTLCALVFTDAFAVGASYYGVGDLEALAKDTHKFESRYLDRLVGPYPESADVYRRRSPIHFAGRMSCPVILFQGLDDRVVPPGQAEMFVEALKAKGIQHEYVALPGEGHGFRKAESIQRVAEDELRFYAKVFGFPLPE